MSERLARRKEKEPIQPGLVVYCGPMFSGKSDELIRELNRAPHAGYKVIAFKPEIDTRRGEDSINSQNGVYYPAIPVKKSGDILAMIGGDIDIVGIDETQFFDEGIVDVCLTLVAGGKRVMVAGLDKDFRGEPFGPMAALKQEAEDVVSLHAYCAECGHPASFTQRIVNGHPANYNDPIVIVGAAELYEARCRTHHEVPGRPSVKKAHYG